MDPTLIRWELLPISKKIDFRKEYFFSEKSLYIQSALVSPKPFAYIKAKRQDQIGIPPLMSDTGIKVDSLGKAETLNAQFQQVFTQEDVTPIPDTASCGTVGMDPVIFHVEGIKKLLQNLDCKKRMVQIISLLGLLRILLLKLLM